MKHFAYFLFAALGFIQLPQLAFGALKAPQSTVKFTSQGQTLKITAAAPNAHHFNLQAPNSLKHGSNRIKPSVASEQKIEFSIAETHDDLFLNLYICDEKKTFCEKHSIKAFWDDKSNSHRAAYESGEQAPKAAEISKETGAIKTDHGFILNQPDIALARAQKEKKPLIIDFFGIWCPPCNMLDEKVFLKPAFKNATKNFIKLKLDADSEVSWELKSKYRVGGYPTVIIADSNADEIHRIVGYRPAKEFTSEIKKALTLASSSLEDSKKKADAGDAASNMRMGSYHLERGEYDDAITYFGRFNPKPEGFFEARLGALKNRKFANESELNSEKRKILGEMVHAFPKSVVAVLKQFEIASLIEDKEEKQKITQDAISGALQFTSHPKSLQGTDYTPGDIYESIAQAQEELGAMAEAKSYWTKAAEEFKRGVSKKDERGNNLELGYCLWKSGNISAAETLYRSLEKAYPNEFTFYYQHGYMLSKLQRHAEAEVLAKSAFDHSYGDNRLRAAHLLAETLVAQGKKSEAKALVNKVLTSLKLPSDPALRTHRYAKALKELREKKL